MEKLNYLIDDSTIAELLGVQNFTNKESAILELVKNSFDARARKLEIIFLKDEICIIDDGIGMNIEDIRTHWMHIGRSSKEYVVIDKDENERILSGSKGIGRFALSRLGREIEVYSEKKDDNAVLWKTNWEKISLDELDGSNQVGTKIKINKLRDKWNDVNINKLKNYLGRTFKNEFMEIYLIYEDKIEKVEKYLKKPILGINCLTAINLSYNSQNKSLTCEILSDEFREEAKKYYKNGDINYFKKTIDISKELKNDKDLKISANELSENLEVLGNFKAELYFVLTPTKIDSERFLYKYLSLDDKYDSGVILYRNSFSISSYDGSKDWIGFSKRARKSPATAIHPTGAWRVRDNNIAGKVEIDKKDNEKLQDLSNRQGLEENIYYEIFLKILDKGLSTFERYRQSIIREINKKNMLEDIPESLLLKTVLKNPEKIKELNEDEINKVMIAVKDLKTESQKYKIKATDVEKKYRYDVRILNKLSTSGLKVTAIAHDLENMHNKVQRNSEYLIKALKSYDLWKIVDDPKNKTKSNKNIPGLIEKNEVINKKLSVFMSTILQNVRKSQFEIKEVNIFELLKNIKDEWKEDYSRLEFELLVEKDVYFITSEDIIKVIFDNLILNSFQQNKDQIKIKIKIEIKRKGKYLEILYKDFGKGLPDNYKEDPFKILEVHESSREDGHGLGMWIINNTVDISGGKILEIGLSEENKGFKFRFLLGGEIDGKRNN